MFGQLLNGKRIVILFPTGISEFFLTARLEPPAPLRRGYVIN